jgi:hypothetical protein
VSLDFKLGLVSGLCIGIAFCSIFLTIAIPTIRNYKRAIDQLLEDLIK